MSIRRRFAPAEALRLSIVMAASLGAIQPLLSRGLPADTFDGMSHLYFLLDFDETFRAAALYPWIAPHLALDFGYAAFTFYSPLEVYLGESFHLLGLGYIASLKACFVVAVLGSGLGAYLLARDLFGWRSGLAAAVVYEYVPYHLVDIYTRGDLAEALGQAILPFAFWGTWRVARQPSSKRVAFAGVALGSLILAHNITALLAAPVLLAFLAVSSCRELTRRSLIALLASGALALAVSAIYWLPVLSQLGQVNTSALTKGSLDYHSQFVPIGNIVQRSWIYRYDLLRDAGDWFQPGRAQIVLTIVATLWVIITRPARFTIFVFTGLAVAVLLWLQQSGSTVIWDHAPFAAYVQFPSRLNTYLGLMSALLLGAFVASLGRHPSGKLSARHTGSRTVVGMLLEVAAIAIFLAAALLNLPRVTAPLQESEVNLPTVWQRENGNGLIAGGSLGDYLPPGVQGVFFQDAHLPAPASLTDTVPRLTAIQSNPLGLVARVESGAQGTVLFDRLLYPGWQASVDGRTVSASPSMPRGIIEVTIPAGIHVLRLSDVGTPFEQAGLAIEAIGLLVVLIICVRPDRPAWPQRLLFVIALASTLVVGIVSSFRPPRELAGGVTFGNAARLVGSRVDRVPATQPGVVDVTLLWEAMKTPLPNCVVKLQLVDAAGHIVANRRKVPSFGMRPCSEWWAGEIIRDHEQIRLAPGVPTGQYHLLVGLSLDGQDESAAADPPSDLGPSGRAPKVLEGGRSVDVGIVNAEEAPAPSPLFGADPIGATVGEAFSLDRARIRAPGLGNQSSMLSSEHRFVARIAPGDRLQVDLAWKSLADTSTNYAVFVHLLDANQHLVGQQDNWPDLGNLPTAVWFPGDELIDRYQIATKRGLAPGIYSVTAGMYTRLDLKNLPVRGPHSGGYQVVLGQVKVTNRDHIFGQPRPVSPFEATFGRQIALVGASLAPRAASANAPLVVNLAWRALAQPSADYTVFVHLLDAKGHLVAQHDGQPLAGAYPTGEWDPGDTVDDTVEISLPPKLPTGAYTVEVGLYRLDTGTRLTLPNGATSTLIGTIDRK